MLSELLKNDDKSSAKLEFPLGVSSISPFKAMSISSRAAVLSTSPMPSVKSVSLSSAFSVPLLRSPCCISGWCTLSSETVFDAAPFFSASSESKKIKTFVTFRHYWKLVSFLTRRISDI